MENNTESLRDLFVRFKPAILFLVKFLVIYLVGNVVYGLYIESVKSGPDLLTVLVTNNVSVLLNGLGEDTQFRVNAVEPTVSVLKQGNIILNVYEGCNGINVMIVFFAFLVAYGGTIKRLMLFSIVGLGVIHIANLSRIGLLYFISQDYNQYFYFVHKYLFTAILYVCVFVLWWIWIRISKEKSH
jgi:exosortase family protein XrtF